MESLLTAFTYTVATSRSRRPSKQTEDKETPSIDVGFNLTFEKSKIIDSLINEAIDAYNSSDNENETMDLRCAIDIFIQKSSSVLIPIERWWLGIHPTSTSTSIHSLFSIDSFDDNDTAALATALRSTAVLARTTTGHLYHDQLKKQIGSPDSLSFAVSISQTKLDPVVFSPVKTYSIPQINTLNDIIVSIAVEYSSFDRSILDSVISPTDESTFDFVSSSSSLSSLALSTSVPNTSQSQYPFAQPSSPSSSSSSSSSSIDNSITDLINDPQSDSSSSSAIVLNPPMEDAKTTTMSSKDSADLIQVTESSSTMFSSSTITNDDEQTHHTSLPFNGNKSDGNDVDLVTRALNAVNTPIPCETEKTSSDSFNDITQHREIFESLLQ